MSLQDKLKSIYRRLEHSYKRVSGKQKIPPILTDRIRKMGILSFLFLLIGAFMGLQMKSPGFIIWSVILGAIVFMQAYRLQKDAESGNYETVEGIVLDAAQSFPGAKFQKIKISLREGGETVLLLEKRIRLEKGCQYRFYFRSRVNDLSGIGAVDAALNTGTFYGYEKTG